MKAKDNRILLSDHCYDKSSNFPISVTNDSLLRLVVRGSSLVQFFFILKGYTAHRLKCEGSVCFGSGTFYYMWLHQLFPLESGVITKGILAGSINISTTTTTTTTTTTILLLQSAWSY